MCQTLREKETTLPCWLSHPRMTNTWGVDSHIKCVTTEVSLCLLIIALGFRTSTYNKKDPGCSSPELVLHLECESNQLDSKGISRWRVMDCENRVPAFLPGLPPEPRQHAKCSSTCCHVFFADVSCVNIASFARYFLILAPTFTAYLESLESQCQTWGPLAPHGLSGKASESQFRQCLAMSRIFRETYCVPYTLVA